MFPVDECIQSPRQLHTPVTVELLTFIASLTWGNQCTQSDAKVNICYLSSTFSNLAPQQRTVSNSFTRRQQLYIMTCYMTNELAK